MDGRQVLELMPAAGSRGDDDRTWRLRTDLLDEWRGDLEGEIVLRFERTESTCHPATTGVEESGLSSGQTRGQSRHETGFDQRFGMAMRVDRDLAGLVIELKRVPFALEQIVDELFEEKATPGD